MRPALLLLSLLAAAAVAPATTHAASKDAVAGGGSSSQQFRLLAQRQPGGLPGRSDSDEDGGPGAKQAPGGLPDRAQRPAAPVTRSLQNPQPRGRSDAAPEAGESTDKKATRGPKKAPDKGN
jgi:hypothetical protein